MKYFGRSTPSAHPSIVSRYLFGLVAVSLAVSVNGAFSVLRGIPFALSFLAVSATAMFGGFGPGLVATLTSALLVNYFVKNPRFSFSTSPVDLLQTGIFVAVASTICLIVRQREAKEERLETVENHFQTTLRSIGDAVVATDETGAVTFLNDCAEKLTEWTLTEAQGRPLSEILILTSALTGAVVANPVTEVMQSGQKAGLANHTVLTSRTGKTYHIEDSAAPIRTTMGDIKGVVLVFRDVTRDYEKEQQRKDSEQKLRALIDGITEGFQSFDSDWNFTYINAQGAAMSGYTPEDLLGKNHWEVFPEAIGTKFETALRGAADEKRTTKVIEYYPPLGKWFQVTAYPTGDGVSALFQDITAEIANEEKLRVADRLAMVGRLAASVSHEINNPLEAVANLIYICKGSTQETAVRELLDQAERQLFRAAHIAKQTLTFYRAPADAEPVSIAKAIRDAAILFEGKLQSCQIRLVKQIPEDAVVYIAEGDLIQIIANLISNALDVAPPNSEVHLQISKDSERAVVEISDSGPGIPPGLASKIFEPFFTTKKETGTGLGLWVVKNILERHNGMISVSSPDGDGKGAKFTVTLPLAQTLEKAKHD